MDPNLRIFATFEEGGDPDEPDVIIPHNHIFLVVSGYLENVLEDCNLELAKVTDPRNKRDHTFETFPASLLEESFFLAVIRYVTRVFLDVSKGVNLELLDFLKDFIVQLFKRRVIDVPLDLTLSKYSSVLRHLMLLDRRRLS